MVINFVIEDSFRGFQIAAAAAAVVVLEVQ